MEEKSISDIIEDYLKQILGQDESVEIRRAEIADRFHVVPSQINYVIKTRFKIENGYLVRSKRGGGGYIRIERVQLLGDDDILDLLLNSIGNSLSEHDADDIINTLYQQHVITRREGNLMLVMVAKQTLEIGNRNIEDQLRAKVMISLLSRLKYEN